jgi:protease-4
MNIIKQGAIKDSGSPFHKMTPEEERVWQDLVDYAYRQFVGVVETGRPQLANKLLEPFEVQPLDIHPPPGVVQGPAPSEGPGEKGEKKTGPYRRYRADGGIFTADQAKKYGLIDDIGDLEAAAGAAAKAAGLGPHYNVVKYERHKSVVEQLLGVRATRPGALLDPGRLQAGLSPRLWYLAPGYEAAGILAAIEAEKEAGR